MSQKKAKIIRRYCRKANLDEVKGVYAFKKMLPDTQKELIRQAKLFLKRKETP